MTPSASTRFNSATTAPRLTGTDTALTSTEGPNFAQTLHSAIPHRYGLDSTRSRSGPRARRPFQNSYRGAQNRTYENNDRFKDLSGK